MPNPLETEVGNVIGEEATRILERQCKPDGIAAAPLVLAIERAYAVARGIEAVLTLTINSAFLVASVEDGNDEVPSLKGSTVDYLQRFARVSAQLLAEDLVRVGAWTDERASESRDALNEG